jgi:plastocyanin
VPRIHGVVTYSGKISLSRFPRGEDAACAHRLLDPVEVPSVERNAENRVAGALVIAKSVLAEGVAAAEPAELRISACGFSPPIVALEEGQKVRIVNEDDALHSLLAEVDGAVALDVGLPFAGMAAEAGLPRTGEPIHVRCRRHPWMSAAVVRVERHPWAVTDGEGRFAIEGLADGPQVFSVWHPWLGALEVTATVDAAASLPVELTYADSAGVRLDVPAQR